MSCCFVAGTAVVAAAASGAASRPNLRSRFRLIYTCARCLDKHRSGFFSDKDKPGSKWIRAKRPPQPTTMWMPSMKGVDMLPPDEDIPWKQRIQMLLEWWPAEIKKLGAEVKWTWKHAELRNIGHCARDAETKVEFQFDKADTFDRFTVSADQDWDEGFSEAELLPSRHGTAIFRGRLDTTVPKDGRVKRAGWVNLRSDPLTASFGRARQFEHWMNFTHLVVKVRGDGRIYMVHLNSPGQYDVNWGNLWSFPLFTHGGPYWQLTKIPFSKFYLNVYGRIQDGQHPFLRVNRCNSVGISLHDRITGPFQLEIDWIGAYYDISHKELFAYELYKVPFGIH